ncbi:ExbD/TolR family protein [Polymorphum gilvum]|uniref:Biopolymer transport protein ExbD/TolR n=1 Tax=Polymorphum gilvum (strain LMG 25793 / CGMCC 1.9160 / SL003B-26A1) TaxID=991905 RepID=F2IYY0_POLGS|nr:biopolymer transporter ExbD [Polymorphum gilvum]ADZ70595.1 hypothetical protein SL003B_2170 [Polymorphum gilvum SL003B-26A1]
MRLKVPSRRAVPDNTIPLINIVFLMLIFFLFAGSVARDDARRIEPPANISEDENVRSTGALVIDSEGRLFLGDAEVTLEDYLATQAAAETGAGSLRIAADGGLPADRLEEVLAQLAGSGAKEVVLITRKVQK